MRPPKILQRIRLNFIGAIIDALKATRCLPNSITSSAIWIVALLAHALTTGHRLKTFRYQELPTIPNQLLGAN